MLNVKRLIGFHWNIQQAAGKGETIPEIVFDEIKRVMPDFGVVTEYSKNADNRSTLKRQLRD